MDSQGVTLSSDQAALLDYLVTVADGPASSPFHCGRTLRMSFAWIIHSNVPEDARIVHWDDLMVLNSAELIELNAGDDPDDLTFMLTELAYRVHARSHLQLCDPEEWVGEGCSQDDQSIVTMSGCELRLDGDDSAGCRVKQPAPEV